MLGNKMNIGQKLKSLSKTIILVFSMLLPVVAWGHENGIYTISNEVSHDNPVGQGMARSYTETTSDVEITDSGTFVTLAFNNTQYMGEFSISVNGSNVSYEQSSAGNNIKKLKFQVPNLSASITVGLFVIPMDTNVEYTVTLNEGSLQLIQATAPKVVEESPVPSESTEIQPIESANTTTTQESTQAPGVQDTPANSPVVTNVQTSPSPSSEVAEEKAVVEKKQPEASAENIVTSKPVTSETANEEETANKEEQKTQDKVSNEETNKVESESEQKANQVAEVTDEEKAEQTVEEINKESSEETAPATDMMNEEKEVADTKESDIVPIIVGILIVGTAIGYVIYKKKK